jgi:quercetin dioxygenase-like cupin family protein
VDDRAVVAVEDGEVLSDRAERTVRAVFEHPLLDVTWSRYEPGQCGPDAHVHHRHLDGFYVVEGELEFGVGPDLAPVRAPAGTLVLVPPEVVHTFVNSSDATVRWLNFHAPAVGFVDYLRGRNDAFDADDPPADGGRPASEATVGPGGAQAQFAAHVVELDAGERVEPTHVDGAEAWFVLDGELDGVGPRTWLTGAGRVADTRVRLLHVRAPA